MEIFQQRIQRNAVLVTGGAGYIGSHAAKALAEAGYLPIVVDDLSEGHAWAVQHGPLVQARIHDTARLVEVMESERVQAVMHFAASAYVGDSVVHPERYYMNNVVGSAQLLAAMREAGVRRIVFSSTCATYGTPQTMPISEETEQAPINPYGETKRAVEQMLRWYGEAYGLRWAVLRYFNAAGADPHGSLGEVHRIETHLIPRALFAAMGLGPPLQVFGADYPTPDGTCVRDYIHVTDLADAHVRALEWLGAHNEPFAANLGTGQGSSVKQVIAAVEHVTGRTVPVLTAARRAGDPPVLVSDCRRARSLLEWTPQHSALDSMVGTAHAFFRQNQHRLTYG
jgi:UDP-arabinose 4-epimerase